MKIRSKLFWFYVGLAIIYALVNFIAAPPRSVLQQYHISAAGIRALNITVVAPIIVIWFISLYGFQKLSAYTRYIRNNKDGQQVAHLSRGTLLLSIWLPLSSTISAVLNWVGQNHHQFIAAITIFQNYFGLVIPLAAFYFLSRGARGLSEIVKQRPAWGAMNVMALGLIVIGILYSYFIARAHATIATTYHTPTSLVLLTIVVPYVFSWYLGLLAAYELHLYTYKVKGVIYRKSWNALAIGVSWLIFFSIVFQYITVVTAKFTHLPLGKLLLLVYGVIAVLAVGYIFIARGAKKLTRIEEV